MTIPSTRKSTIILLIGIFAVIALLGIGQDLLHSIVNKSSFYLSESSLFKVIWILFIPFFYLGHWLTGKKGRKLPIRNWWQVMVSSLAFSLLHVGVASALVSMLSALFLDHTYQPAGVFSYFVSEDLYIVLLVYLIGSVYPVIIRKTSKTKDRVTKEPLDVISVKSNHKLIPIPTREILYIQSDRPYLAIVTKENRYLHTASLNSLLPELDGQYFVRVHRSTIINTRHIAYLQSRSNGDYDVFMNNGEEVRMSRNYSQDLKEKL